MNSFYIFIFIIVLTGRSLAIPAIQPRVIGGHEAKPHEFPYLVSIAIADTKFSNCGGTILSEDWILTAGHCVFEKDMNEFIILAGKHNLSAVEDGEQIIKPAKFIPYEHFDASIIGPDDIGLIKLATPLKFSDTVKKIPKLPIKNSEPEGQGVVSGWGSTSHTLDPEFPETVQTVEVTILPYETCADALKSITYTHKHLCTGPLTGNVGHCSGDSGGALVQHADDPKEITIVGIISFNYTPCGTINIPPAFTSVSHYIDWIEGITGLQFSEKTTEKIPEKPTEKIPEKTTEKIPEKIPEKNTEKIPEKTTEKK